MLSRLPISGWGTWTAGVLAFSCSFYTDCPCANQPKTGGAGGGMPSAGSGGTAQAGGTGGTGTGGSGVGGTDMFAGSGGEAGGGEVVMPGVWRPATGNLAGKSVACGNVTFMSAKPDENLVIAAVSKDGLYGSRDGGTTWKPLGTGSTSALIDNLPTTLLYDPDDGQRFWEVGIYGGPGVYQTDDGGKSFRVLGNVSHTDYLSVDWSDPKRRFMLLGGHEQAQLLWRSDDSGDTWTDIGPDVPDTCKWSTLPVIIDADNWVLGCWTSSYRTSDAGAQWAPVSSFGGTNAPLITKAGVLYWAIDGSGGLVRSDDAGQTWERVVGGGVISQIHPIELPDGSIATTSGDQIVRSTDEGRSWKSITPSAPYTPNGIVYSADEGAFFIWQNGCEKELPVNGILRFDFSDF